MTHAPSSSSALQPQAAKGKKFAIVASRYHEELSRELHHGAVEALKKWGAAPEDVRTVWVPGAFELPITARALSHLEFDAIICLGVIVKGETFHDQYLAVEVARGISGVALSSGIPVAFGVLTTQTLEQAKARCGGARGHKGIEAAETAVAMVGILDEIEQKGAKELRSVGFGGS
jgi:6,7-dimethyl-8-ribityllumazine synthase